MLQGGQCIMSGGRLCCYLSLNIPFFLKVLILNTVIHQFIKKLKNKCMNVIYIRTTKQTSIHFFYYRLYVPELRQTFCPFYRCWIPTKPNCHWGLRRLWPMAESRDLLCMRALWLLTVLSFIFIWNERNTIAPGDKYRPFNLPMLGVRHKFH